jgi:hypothetical protein
MAAATQRQHAWQWHATGPQMTALKSIYESKRKAVETKSTSPKQTQTGWKERNEGEINLSDRPERCPWTWHLVTWLPGNLWHHSRTNWTRRIKELGWRSTFLMSNYIVVLSPLIQLIRPPFRGCKSLLEFVPADMKDMKWMNRLKSLNQFGNSRCRFQVNVCRMLVLSIYAKCPHS